MARANGKRYRLRRGLGRRADSSVILIGGKRFTSSAEAWRRFAGQPLPIDPWDVAASNDVYTLAESLRGGDGC